MFLFNTVANTVSLRYKYICSTWFLDIVISTCYKCDKSLGPVPDTFASFWRMVWECESQTIVILTNLEEKGRVKCHQYWPDDKVTISSSIRVSMHEQLDLADYTVRTFSLKKV